MAEPTFSLQEQEAQDRNLVVQRQGMTAGRAKAASSHNRQVLADSVFHGAIVSAHEETESDTTEEQYSNKRKIKHTLSS